MSDTRQRPEPEPIRFYGTTWVDHSGGYLPRRIALGLGALLLAAAGAYVLRLAYQGTSFAGSGGVVGTLLVVAFALSSSMAFSRTLTDYARGPDEARAADPSMRPIKVIGFLGVLLAYAARTLVEAPGEKRLRAEYDRAVERYERRGAARAARRGNPAARRASGRSGRRR